MTGRSAPQHDEDYRGDLLTLLETVDKTLKWGWSVAEWSGGEAGKQWRTGVDRCRVRASPAASLIMTSIPSYRG